MKVELMSLETSEYDCTYRLGIQFKGNRKYVTFKDDAESVVEALEQTVRMLKAHLPANKDRAKE